MIVCIKNAYYMTSISNKFSQLDTQTGDKSSTTQSKTLHSMQFFKKNKFIVSVLLLAVFIVVSSIGLLAYQKIASTDPRSKAAEGFIGREFKEVSYPIGKEHVVSYFYNRHYAAQPNPPEDTLVNDSTNIPNFYQSSNASNFPLITNNNNEWVFDTAKSGVIFKIPEEARSSGFYKIEATIEEPDYLNTFHAYLGAYDDLLTNNPNANGMISGLKDDATNYTLYFETSDRTKAKAAKESSLTDAQKAHNDRFTRWVPVSLDTNWQKTDSPARLKRKIKFEIYVTPLGMYTVMDGYNMSTIPGDYIGGPLQLNTNPRYIYIGKFSLAESAKLDNSEIPVRQQAKFSDIKVTTLDTTVNTVQDVNMYFIHKFVKEGAVEKFRALQTVSDKSYKLNFMQAMWVADTLRMYDYYYGTDHKADVISFTEYALRDPDFGFQKYIADKLPEYSKATATWQQSLNGYYRCEAVVDPIKKDVCNKNRVKATVDVNHDVINTLNIALYQLAIVDSYIPSSLRTEYMNTFAPLVDESLNYMKGDGTFPPSGDWHIGDTFMEEFAWLQSFYTAYVGLYYNLDTSPTRIPRLLDYITFIDSHTHGKSKSLRETLPEYTFSYLSDDYLDYKIRTIHDDGKIDNHNFSPSINYGTPGSRVFSWNFLKSMGIAIPIAQNNTKQVFETTTKQNLDLLTLKHKPTTITKTVVDPRDSRSNPILFPTDHYATIPAQDAKNIGQAWKAYINYDFYARLTPSLLEDWGNSFTGYHTPEAMGDYEYANQHAKSVYFLHNPSTGRFFCSHGLFKSCFDFQKVQADGTTIYPGKLDYLIAEPIFAEYFSARSKFPKPNHTVAVTASVSSDTEARAGQTIIIQETSEAQAAADQTKIILGLNPPLDGIVDIGVGEHQVFQATADKGTVMLLRSYLPSAAGEYSIKTRRGVNNQYYLGTGPAWSNEIKVIVQATEKQEQPPEQVPITDIATNPAPPIDTQHPIKVENCIPWTVFPRKKITTNAPTQQYGAMQEQAEYLTDEGTVYKQAVWEGNLGLIRDVPLQKEVGYAPDFRGLNPPNGDFNLKVLAKTLLGNENAPLQANSATTLPSGKTAQIIWVGNTGFRRASFDVGLQRIEQPLDQYISFCAGKQVEAASLWQGYERRQYTHIVEHLLCVNQDGSGDAGYYRKIPLENNTVAWDKASGWEIAPELINQGATNSKLESTSAEVLFNPNGPNMQISNHNASDYPYGALLRTEWRYNIDTDDHTGYLQYVPLTVDGTPNWPRACPVDI